MASTLRSSPIPLILFLQLCFSFLSTTLAISSGSSDGYTINGRVKIESTGVKGFGLPGKHQMSKSYLMVANGLLFLGLMVTSHWTHMIEVAAIGYFFSPVRVDVSARNPGKIQAALTENRKGLIELVLEPLREEQYYEIREPFSIMSVVKSPMGLMMGFMLIVMFLMPKLVENMGEVDLAYGDWQAHSLTRAFISLAQVVH
ncbi:ER membrane protein complex subunit 7-like [Vitis vinifera]|uniref:ER membrane protein complex subunit 7-like n=1 Tax=Vitis vinifera TaxID=29760 RepID=A0A438CJX2_VITVI|nr:ER membrane protein complex subunit 7-like [Vitis vinifera]